jgi:hypothetical protein
VTKKELKKMYYDMVSIRYEAFGKSGSATLELF